MADWSEMSFTELSRRYEDLVSAVRADLDALAQLGPALVVKAAELGVTLNLDYSALAAQAAGLAGGRAKSGGGGRRGAKPGRSHRYMLVWKKNGQPVVDDDGQPLRFRNQLRMLRGPKYERLIGPGKIGTVQLVDTENGDQVVEAAMSLGPAPGGRRPRA